MSGYSASPASGRVDHMGFRWFRVQFDGKPVLKEGVPIKIKAVDAAHAVRIAKQFYGENPSESM